MLYVMTESDTIVTLIDSFKDELPGYYPEVNTYEKYVEVLLNLKRLKLP
jgi:hypothetical protein